MQTVIVEIILVLICFLYIHIPAYCEINRIYYPEKCTSGVEDTNTETNGEILWIYHSTTDIVKHVWY